MKVISSLGLFPFMACFMAWAALLHPIVVEAAGVKRIGVLAFSEEDRYEEARKGIVDQMKKDGFGAPSVNFTVENAGGSKAKAAELSRKFAAAEMDLIITLGTSATIAMSREIKDVPIVFAMVYDPVAVGISKSWNHSGNNTTGASPGFPMSRLVAVLKEFVPVKRLAVLYTPGEKNTEEQLAAMQETQAASQIRVVPVILTNKEEIPQTLGALVKTVDAIYLSGGALLGTNTQLIVDIANKAKVVTITHLDDLANNGVLLAVATSSYQVGRLAGKKAVKILKGAKPSSIPIEAEKTLFITLNKKSAQAGQFRVPPNFMKKVSKTIE